MVTPYEVDELDKVIARLQRVIADKKAKLEFLRGKIAKVKENLAKCEESLAAARQKFLDVKRAPIVDMAEYLRVLGLIDANEDLVMGYTDKVSEHLSEMNVHTRDIPILAEELAQANEMLAQWGRIVEFPKR